MIALQHTTSTSPSGQAARQDAPFTAAPPGAAFADILSGAQKASPAGQRVEGAENTAPVANPEEEADRPDDTAAAAMQASMYGGAPAPAATDTGKGDAGAGKGEEGANEVAVSPAGDGALSGDVTAAEAPAAEETTEQESPEAAPDAMAELSRPDDAAGSIPAETGDAPPVDAAASDAPSVEETAAPVATETEAAASDEIVTAQTAPDSEPRPEEGDTPPVANGRSARPEGEQTDIKQTEGAASEASTEAQGAGGALNGSEADGGGEATGGEAGKDEADRDLAPADDVATAGEAPPSPESQLDGVDAAPGVATPGVDTTAPASSSVAEAEAILNEASEAPRSQPGTTETLFARTTSAAWMRSVLNRHTHALSMQDGWQVMEMNLDESQGSVTVKTRRNDEGVSVSVGFSDPRVAAAVQANAGRIEHMLASQYESPVDLSFFNEDGGRPAKQGKDAARDGSAGVNQNPSGSAGEESRAGGARSRLFNGAREWVG